MTVEAYQKAMAKLGIDREALATGLPPQSRASVRELHEPAYLPGGYEKTKVPLAPPAVTEDLSHLNPKWRRKRKAT